MASTNRKIALIKNNVSTRQKIRFHQPDEGFVEKAFPLYGKVVSTLNNLKIFENVEKTGVH